MTTLTILPHAETDLTIPPMSAISDRAGELRADALRLADLATARQLELLISALGGGMRMAWSYGDLLVSSASTPGAVYTVSCGACTCPARKPCKHLKLAELLLDMFEAACDTADMEADADPPNEPNPLGDTEGDEQPSGRTPAALGRRLAELRAPYQMAA